MSTIETPIQENKTYSKNYDSAIKVKTETLNFKTSEKFSFQSKDFKDKKKDFKDKKDKSFSKLKNNNPSGQKKFPNKNFQKELTNLKSKFSKLLFFYFHLK